MTRDDLIERIAWAVRGDRDWKKSTLDLLSELDRSPKWRDVADRVRRAPGAAWGAFLAKVERRIEEIR